MSARRQPVHAVITVEDLLATYSPAYYDTWDETFDALRSNPADRAIVEHLVGVLESGRTFREPVVLDNEQRLVRNGTHRVAAAVQAGARTLATLDDYPDAPYSGEVVTLAVRLTRADGATVGAQDDIDAATDWAFEWLGSLPLDDDTWASCDVMGGHTRPGRDTVIDGTWYVAHARADDLTAALTRLAADHGWTLSVDTVSLEVDNAEEADLDE